VADRFDVIVVGARCAGSPLATLLARQGVDVAVVEQATFPRDTLSTHIFEADGLAFLDRLGLTERLRETGAPFMQRVDTRLEDVRINSEWPLRPGDVGGLVSIRRHVLDPILAEAAEEAGADVRMATKVTGLIHDGDRVAGVRVTGDAGDDELRARLVVGADGRNSTVARLAGARKYNVCPNERVDYWGYFEGANIGEPTFVFHRWADRAVVANPTDSGLYEVQVLPELKETDRFRRDLEPQFMEHALSCEPVAAALDGAHRVGKFFGMVRWEGFLREASKPGWVLTGDAGHFKDPAPGRGIGDAFLQADALAPAIVEGLGGSDRELDKAMGRFWRWRDKEFAEYYWFGCDLGAGGPVPAVLPEMARALKAKGKAGLLFEATNHRRRPSRILTPPRLLAAVGRLLRRPGSRAAVLRETGSLMARDMRRRFRNRRPVYAEQRGVVRDSGPTEVEDSVAA
jgi:flavin-dependent dehydrogenase